MKLQKIVAAVALLAAGAANAAIDSFDGVTAPGNGSMILVKADTTGSTTGGLTVDLGFNFNDFANGGANSVANTTIVWDFANNTINKNGSLITGITNDWASQLALYAGDAAETKWAVLSGSQKGNTPYAFLASGQPTASQLTQQNSSVTANMVQINLPLLTQPVNNNKGTLTTADNGAYAMGATDIGYVGTAYSLTSIAGWKNNIKWSTWNLDGASTNLWQVINNGSEKLVADSALYTLGENDTLDTSGLVNGVGTFTLSGTTLTWKTASITTVTPSIPEPSTYALALVGLLGLALSARRKAK